MGVHRRAPRKTISFRRRSQRRGDEVRAIALAPSVALAAFPPAAQPSGGARPAPARDEKARGVYEDGRHAYDLADYDRAIEAFRAAYELTEAPELLFDAAQAYRRKGNSGCRMALEFYKNYVRVERDAARR